MKLAGSSVSRMATTTLKIAIMSQGLSESVNIDGLQPKHFKLKNHLKLLFLEKALNIFI